MIQKIILAIKEIFAQPLVTLISFLAILFMILFYTIFNIVSANFNDYLVNKFGKKIPPKVIEVSADKGGRGNSQNRFITARDLRAFRRFKGVKEVKSFPVSKVPIFAVIRFGAISSIFNIGYQTDVVCIGAPYYLVKNSIDKSSDKRTWKRWKPGKDIPFLLPESIVDLYNQTMAGSNNLPKIDDKLKRLLLGTSIQLTWGRSSLTVLDGYELTSGRFSGITDRVVALGLVVPEKVINHYNKKFDRVTEYIGCEVSVRSHDDLLPVSKKIRKMGFVAETEFALSSEIKNLKQKGSGFLNLLIFIMGIISIISISVLSILSVINRIDYYKILRMLGASKTFLSLMILFKYALIGLLASTISIVVVNGVVATYLNGISIMGFKLDIGLTSEFQKDVILYGMLIPIFSVSPAIIKLYFKIF